MEQMQESAFCSTHGDYMIEIVCLDYSTEDCYRMCKKCKKEIWKKSDENLNNKLPELQQKFEGVFFKTDRQAIEEQMKKKIDYYLSQFTKQLSDELKKIPVQFLGVLNKIISLQKQIPTDKAEFAKLKSEYFSQYIQIKQNINDILFKQIEQVEQNIFSHDLLQNKNLYELPENKSILQNLDGYNLLRKFEQLYINKQEFINEESINAHKKEKKEKIKELQKNHQTIISNCDKIITSIEKEITKQKDSMIARITNYKAIFQENLKQLQTFLNKWENLNNPNELEIQVLQQSYFVNQLNFDKLDEALEKQAKEQIAAQSRLCQIGKIEISVSVEKVQQLFCINFIPILIHKTNGQAFAPRLNLLPHPPDEAYCIRNIELNREGNINGRAIVMFPDHHTQANFVNGQIQGDMIEDYTDASLFSLNLTEYFKTNQFSFVKITQEDRRETYIEKDKKWIMQQSDSLNEKKYTLTLDQMKEGKYIFSGIKLNNLNEIDTECEITFECIFQSAVSSQVQSERSSKLNDISFREYTYKGRMNNLLQYHGQGVLTKGNLIKSGEWKNGVLNGKGSIQKKNSQGQPKLIYEGMFKDDKFEGEGKQFYPDGYFYDGNFSAGLRKGKGKIRRELKNGVIKDIETTEWKDDFPLSDRCSIF